jgi:hypothetical protein
LEQVIQTIFSKQDQQSSSRPGFWNQALADIKEAYKTFTKSMDDILDITQDGKDGWDAAKKQYESSTAKVEL